MLDTGQSAPDFTLPRDGGGQVTLSSLQPSKVVLYFYPKDDTSGCTKQAIAFSESVDAFEAAGAIVVGVSRDSIAKHDKFRDKHALKVMLLSDEDGKACQDYGVWVEKSMYGKKYMGIERSTFLIDGSGTIRRSWRKVKVPGHAEEVLAAVREI
jgi:peroxiredoxin Q/BCP